MDNINGIISELKRQYKSPKCELNFNSNFQLLVAVLLSAQCTDKRVNIVTEKLFKVADTCEKLNAMSFDSLVEIIRPCGFYINKAKNLKSLASDLINKYNGQVPKTKEELLTLAGVGEKTANVVLANAYRVPAIAVDTHVFRVSNRLGLASSKTVSGTQKQLEQILPRSFWIDAHHSLVLHGRYICKARTPNCLDCSLKRYCRHYNNKIITELNAQTNKKI